MATTGAFVPGIMEHLRPPQPPAADGKTTKRKPASEACQWSIVQQHLPQQDGLKLHLNQGSLNCLIDVTDILYLQYKDHMTTFVLLGVEKPHELRTETLRQNLCRFAQLEEVGIVQTGRDQMLNLRHVVRLEGATGIYLKWLPKLRFELGDSYAKAVKDLLRGFLKMPPAQGS